VAATLERAGNDPDPEPELPDERLELIFTCCHPALSLEAQVALTLRTLGGLSTGETRGGGARSAGAATRRTASPVVELNRAIAVGQARGAQAGLQILDRLGLHCARAELLRRLGRRSEAEQALRSALALVHDGAERRLIERRLQKLCGVQ
jgi:predicted RNA polymerase sigma factor